MMEVPLHTPHLFIDDAIIADSKDLDRQLRHPEKDNGGEVPILALDDEFGDTAGTLEANGSIVYDPRIERYVMFALGFASSSRNWDRARLYRFTSGDGMNWIKGDNGRPQCVYPRRKHFLHDSETGLSARNIDLFSCFFDPSDNIYPYKGWQWFSMARVPAAGLYYVRSQDGINWSREHQIAAQRTHTIDGGEFTLTGPADVSVFSHDPLSNRFLAILKFIARDPLKNGVRLRSRAFTFIDRMDQPLRQALDGIREVDLVPSGEKKGAECEYDEYYASTAWRCGELWLGMLKIWHGEENHPWSAAGCAYYKLIYSRDGTRWKRVPFDNQFGQPEVFLANGTEGGNGARNDGGYMTDFSTGPLEFAGEQIIYYGSSSFGKNHATGIRVTGGGIFRARMRPEGYVAVTAGELTTFPITIEGTHLKINSTGTVTVDLLDERNRKIASAEVKGDGFRQEALFDGKPFGTAIRAMNTATAGRPCPIRFSIGAGSRLYAFRID